MNTLPISRDLEPWTPAEAEGYLLGLELFGMHFGLSRMRRLMSALGGPNDRFASVHVVGTNGKSSTTLMIAALLERHGQPTGAYISPHLISFAERIQVAGREVGPARFAQAVARAARAAELVDRTLSDEGDRVTQFEALTAAAYSEFVDAGVRVAVIEAGLGGHYDATNIVGSKVQVLTNVALEHTRWLGSSIPEIAAEKLDVVRPGGVLVLGPDLDPDAQAVARSVAGNRGARIVVAAGEVPQVPQLRARGAYQRRNFALAVSAASAFLERPLDPEAVRSVAADLLVPGRFDVIDPGDPVTVLDGAHNPSGVAALVDSLPGFLAGRPLCLVVSILEDKDAAAMLSALLPLCSRVICTAASSPRALAPDTLAALARGLGFGPLVEIEADPGRALTRARESGLAGRRGEPGSDEPRGRAQGGADGPAPSSGVVLATGSLCLVADLLRSLRARRS